MPRRCVLAGCLLAAGVVVLAACSGPGAPGAGPPAAGAPSAGSSPDGPVATSAPDVSGLPATAWGSPQPVACMDDLPLDVRIGQTMLVTTTDLPRVQRWLDDGLIAGVLSNGLLGPELAGALQRATYGTRYGALLAADEEGGEVQRYRDVVGWLPSARQQQLTMTPEEVRGLYARHGAALADWGVDLVLAPVVDVGHGPGIGSRAYSEDPQVVAEYAAAAAQGYADAGLTPVLKHFPGHGSAGADTHDDLAAGPPIGQLREVDLLPFTEIPQQVGVGIMVGHTTVPGYSEAPASQSRPVIHGLLVEDLAFDGLIVSDALGMAAAGTDTQGGALVGFLRAGGDLGIVGPGGSVEGRRAVVSALAEGVLTEDRLNEAAHAVLAAKGVDPCEVTGGPVPVAVDESVPADAPVVNPTKEP